MPKKVRKVFGENPETVTVLTTQVAFDENGDAEVEDDVADVLEQIPGYEVEGISVEPSEDPTTPENEESDEEEEPSEEDTEEPEETEEEVQMEEPVKIAKPARPTRKAPSKK